MHFCISFFSVFGVDTFFNPKNITDLFRHLLMLILTSTLALLMVLLLTWLSVPLTNENERYILKLKLFNGVLHMEVVIQ